MGGGQLPAEHTAGLRRDEVRLEHSGPVIGDVDGEVPLGRLPGEVRRHVKHGLPGREAASLELAEFLVNFGVSVDKQVGSHL